MLSRLASLLPASLVLLTVASFATPAYAESPSVVLEALPILGQGSPASDGWNSTLVRVENTSTTPVSGSLQLATEPLGNQASRVLTEAPFSVAGKSRVTLQLPSHDFGAMSAGLVVRAVDGTGARLTQTSAGELRASGPLVFDLSVPTRIGGALRGTGVLIRRSVSHYSRMPRTSLVSVTNPQVSATTGELVLPELASGYSGATVVLSTGATFASLSEIQTQALVEWVLSGGTLALSLARPEDLQDRTLIAMLGGAPLRAAPSRNLLGEATFVVPPDAPGTMPSPSRMGPQTGVPRLMMAEQRLTPKTETAGKLTGFSGANLRETPWGAAASYGLGEVHLLAFEANSEPFLSDPWTQYKLADLVRHAWERQSTIVLPHAATALESPAMDDIRRVLDPNEATRWTIIVSALVLLLYAALAGPLNFYLASRKGRPLRALLHLPLWSAGAMALIVLLGILGKGFKGRARQLALIESGAGMTYASTTRFRGLYASSATELVVRAKHGSVLDVTGTMDDTERVVVIDRDGVRLERLHTKPWQVVVVREDGFVSFGGGISIVQSEQGEISVKNRAARDLLGAVLKVPGRNAVYFPRIADGETVSAGRGLSLPSDIGAKSVDGYLTLRADYFSKKVEEASEGLGAAWSAFEMLTRGEVEWWPEEVPVLIAQLDGGEGRLQDSGLSVDVDRVLVRVVGYGGVL